jgi:nitrite reductase/ring-hydroxylating ferredoxin subunit
MSTWHRPGPPEELLPRLPLALKLDRQQIALFHHEGRFRAIGNRCNHRGGPLSEGKVRGEFVMCPWHAWEYSLVTGKGPPGYDAEAVPLFAVEERADGVWLDTDPVSPRKLVRHDPHPLTLPSPRPSGAPPRVLGISTTAMGSGSTASRIRSPFTIGR